MSIKVTNRDEEQRKVTRGQKKNVLELERRKYEATFAC